VEIYTILHMIPVPFPLHVCLFRHKNTIAAKLERDMNSCICQERYVTTIWRKI